MNKLSGIEAAPELQNVNDRTFLGSLKRQAAHRGDDVAVRFTDGGSYTAPELLVQSGRLAALFTEYGIKAGDRIVILCGNRVEFLWTLFAAGWIGAVTAPLNVSLRGMTLKHPLDELEPSLVLYENATADALVGCGGGANVRLLNVDTDPAFLEIREGRGATEFPVAHAAGPADLVFISYTSGTTGPSKGIMYSNEMTIAFGESNDWLFKYTRHDTAFTCLPLFHGNAVFCTLLPAFRAGALVVYAPRFSASTYWQQVRNERATVLNLLGSMVPILLDQPPSTGDAATTARIALAVPMPNKRFHEFQERFGMKLTSLYGMTDMGVLVGVPHDIPGRPGKCGIENPIWECFLADDDDMPVPDGVIGELLARPRRPHIMQLGYWRNPESTVNTWRNLWFHTGDYLRRDAEGWYEFIDRKKDAMRRFGENISSYEVELALQSHPEVEEVAVYAVAAQLEEDEVMTSMVLKKGSTVTAAELLKHCELELPYYAVPRYYRLVAELPRTQTAKIQKGELRRIGIDDLTWDAGPRGRSKRGR
ncbi:ATP-dependent acyl-CoA ligase [soil metagenome]